MSEDHVKVLRQINGSDLGALVVEVFCGNAKGQHKLLDVRRSPSGSLTAVTTQPKPSGLESPANRESRLQAAKNGDGPLLREAMRERYVVDPGSSSSLECWCRCGTFLVYSSHLAQAVSAGRRRVGWRSAPGDTNWLDALVDESGESSSE